MMNQMYLLKKAAFIFLLSISVVSLKAQQYLWKTGVRDTSYSSLQDFKKTVKQYPNIELVKEKSSPKVIEKRNLTYADAGNRPLKIDAFLPKKPAAKTPAILIVHGGGWRSGDRSQHIPLAQQLAERGYASFTVEYRLSTEAFYPAAVYDLKAAVRWLKANGKKLNIDTAKVAILGFSAGGQLAALVGLTPDVQKLSGNFGNTKYANDVATVIDIDGTLSFVHEEAWETQNKESINASAKWLGYPRTERLDLWEEASPLTYADKNNIPFLFLNSSVERMHAGRDEFTKKMDKKGVYTEVVTFENSPHSFCLYQPWFSQTVNHIDTFLKKVFR
ncbi:alpha/beta hydrolase [Pedobacter sp. SL55]|uniref:alpha/beta hydrolase n=1 Tax=Pedobacter sp. SL55 TaxID=2995161 RepID=UPI00226E1078|nr:alpha/beta hydrolase [Pedobacter sp. SL55]WAC41017.1 alpha/beta hydrolase [Pedobacter sp. SL55]